MSDFFEIDEEKKTVKLINLDDFSVEDLNKYILELSEEIERVKIDLKKKIELKKQAEEFFK
ncbi:DUF1192 domain-containing protein [Pelagibacteraceae bacterium]|nr:DUF1192 domain-containing protein [Pelagibacteraceae bacterium]|tara:strand:+ start:298 stop:480 length:183 start_codon:yes stop_codon:yes gene_type:complete